MLRPGRSPFETQVLVPLVFERIISPLQSEGRNMSEPTNHEGSFDANSNRVSNCLHHPHHYTRASNPKRSEAAAAATAAAEIGATTPQSQRPQQRPPVLVAETPPSTPPKKSTVDSLDEDRTISGAPTKQTRSMTELRLKNFRTSTR